jgi:hypothetical protein
MAANGLIVILSVSLFAAGIEANRAVTLQSVATWTGVAVALVAAIVWVVRVTWKVATERQCILSKLTDQADRLNKLLPVVTEACGSMEARADQIQQANVAMSQAVHRRMDEHGRMFTKLIGETSALRGRCDARTDTYLRMADHLASVEAGEG